MIEESKLVTNQKRLPDLGERRFESLFENLPIPLWEEDFSQVKALLAKLGLVGKDAAFVREYILKHPDLIGQCVSHVSILNVNHACLALHNAPDKATLLNGLAALLTPESHEALREQIVAIAVGKTELEKDSIVQTLHGHLRHVHMHWIVVPGNENDFKRVLISTEDITESRHTEQNMQQEKLFSDAIINSMPGIFYMFDAEGKFLRWNSNFETISRYSSSEVAAMHPIDFFAGEQKDFIRERIAEVFANGASDAEADFVSRDGTRSPYYFSGVRIDLNGQPCLLGVGVDISARKQAERSIRDSEGKFRELFERSGDAILIIENETFVDCNHATVEMLGYHSKEEFLNLHPSKLSPEFQPDGKLSRIKADEMMETAIRNGTHRFEWDHVRKSGQIFPVEVLLTAVSTTPEKRIIHTVWRDITERKRSESEGNLAATVFRHTADGILITSASSDIISVNQAFTDITGYAAHDVIGKNPRILKAGRHDGEFYHTMWQHISEQGVWKGEIWNRRKNGEIFPTWQTITSIRSKTGETLNYVSVFSDITEIKLSQERLERLAHFDEVTGLPNRVLFNKRVTLARNQAIRDNTKIAIMLFDLDGFKNVNDSFGHPIGDDLLRILAQRLNHCTRVEDTLARLGGDEFALLVVGLNSGDDTIDVIRTILEVSQQPFLVEGHTILVSSSIGVSVFPDDALESTDLIRNADAAMYEAKAKGKNTYRFYQAEMTLKAQKRLALEREIRRAIEQHEFEVWYQPQIDLARNCYLGAEALIRWRHPVRGLVSPADFIPLAEQNGLILPIGELVLKQVCADCHEWQLTKLDPKRLSINIAGPQFYRSDIVTIIERLMHEYDIPQGRLEIEITETFMLENPQEIKEILLKIQRLGITTAIDDFGTGYSSLAYLRELPIDTLKIDRAFIHDVPASEKGIAIVRAILALGKSMGYNVVAEGIETLEQFEFLRAEGCAEGQGYYFNKPMPRAEFMLWLQKQHHSRDTN